MRRITVTFPDDDFEALQRQAAKKSISLAHYLRELVDIGRQVEEATAQQSALGDAKPTSSHLKDPKELWKNSLLSVLESRYLIRYLVDHLDGQSSEKRDAVLNAVKEKAHTLVTELLGND